MSNNHQRSSKSGKGRKKKKYTDAMTLLAEIVKEGGGSDGPVPAMPKAHKVAADFPPLAPSWADMVTAHRLPKPNVATEQQLSEQLSTCLQLKEEPVKEFQLPSTSTGIKVSKHHEDPRSVSAFGDDELSTSCCSSTSSSSLSKSDSSESCTSSASRASKNSDDDNNNNSCEKKTASVRVNKHGAIIMEGAEFEVLRDESLYMSNKPMDFLKYTGPRKNSGRRVNTYQPRYVPDYSKNGPPTDWTESNEHTEFIRHNTPMAQLLREVDEKRRGELLKEEAASIVMPEYHRPRASLSETARFLEHHLYRCIFCDETETHTTVSCPATKAKKMNFLFDEKRCRLCFDTEHPAKYCPHDISCQVCSKRHLTYFEHAASFKVSWNAVQLKQRWW